MIGHEKNSSRYQPATISSSAAIVLFSLASILISIAVITNLNWNLEKWDLKTFFNPTPLKNFVAWMFFMLLLISGIIIAFFYDHNYSSRRKRYISFLKRKNATIEYKTKALNAYKAYQKTGNAERFLEKNIDLLEKTLDIDRSQITDKKKKKRDEEK